MDEILRLALEEGYITSTQLEYCQELKKRYPDKGILDILVMQNFLRQEDLLELQKKLQKRGSLSFSKAEKKEDNIFGLLCLRLGYVSKEELDQCLQEQSFLQSQGKPVRLGEIMVKKGLLSPEQVKEVLTLQKKSILQCSSCGAKYNVAKYSPGKKVKCRRCGEILVVPDFLSSPSVEDSIYEDSALPSQDRIPTGDFSPLAETGDLPSLAQMSTGDFPKTQADWDTRETRVSIEPRGEERRRERERRQASLTEWKGVERRKGGDRRQGLERRRSSPSLSRYQKIQALLMGGVVLAMTIAVALLGILITRPSSFKEAKIAEREFQRIYRQISFWEKQGDEKELIPLLEKASEVGKKYLEFAPSPDKELVKNIQECSRKLKLWKQFLKAKKKQDKATLVKILDSLEEKDRVLERKILLLLADWKSREALPYFRDKIASLPIPYGEMYVEALLKYQVTEEAPMVCEILSQGLLRLLKLFEQEGKQTPTIERLILRIIDVLMMFSDPQVVKALGQVVLTSQNGVFILKALDGLIKIGGKETVPIFFQALEIPVETIQQKAKEGILQAGSLALRSIEKRIEKSDPQTPPVFMIQLLGEVAKKNPAAWVNFRRQLRRACETGKWGTAFYLIWTALSAPERPGALEEEMREALRRIAKQPREQIARIYYTRLFLAAAKLRDPKLQIQFAEWMENLEDLGDLPHKDTPKPLVEERGLPKAAVVEVENRFSQPLFLFMKTDTFQKSWEIPPKGKRQIYLEEQTLYDIIAILRGSSVPFLGSELFEHGKWYKLVFQP